MTVATRPGVHLAIPVDALTRNGYLALVARPLPVGMEEVYG